jgi:hypothetical protein
MRAAAFALAAEGLSDVPADDKLTPAQEQGLEPYLFDASGQPLFKARDPFSGQQEGDKYLDLTWCGSMADELVELSRREAALRFLAGEVASMHGALVKGGYREQVFAAPLEAYERGRLASIAREEASDPDGPSPSARLASEIDANRTRLQPGLPRVVADGGCGGGEAPVIVKSEPAGGRVWLITEFSFLYCRASKLDPWDREKCRHWREADDDNPLYLSGTYVYQVRWPQGIAGRGRKSMDYAKENGEAMVLKVKPDLRSPT